MAELIESKDDMSSSNAFKFTQVVGRCNVSGMKSVTVPDSEGYENYSAQIVIYAPKTSDSNDCYAFVVDEGCPVSNDVVLDDNPYTILASGSCELLKGNDKERNISSLVLNLKSNQKKLLFTNDKIVNITGTEDADTIYITSEEETNGVSKTATLDFSTGNDTIYFDGATTVKNISGGGGSAEDTLTLAPKGNTALDLTVKDGKLSGNVEIDVTNNVEHKINIGNIAGDVTIKGDTSTLSFSDGSSLTNATVKSDDGLQISCNTSNTAINLQKIEVNGSVSVTGSNEADTFIISNMGSDALLKLKGGAGNDTYQFYSPTGIKFSTQVEDFGFADSSGNAKDQTLGADIILSGAGSEAVFQNELVSIRLVGNEVKIGNNITINTTQKIDPESVYVRISGLDKIDTYKVTADGAILVDKTKPADDSDTTPVDTDTDDTDDSSADTVPSGSDTTSGGADTVDSGSVEYETILGGDTTYVSVSGSTGGDSTTFDLSNINEATYVDVSTGSSVVKGVTTYDGYNDNTATVINTSIPVENMMQSISRSTLVLTDTDGNEVTVNGVRAGDAIKLGDADNPSVVVLGGESNTAVKAALADADYFLGQAGENTTLDFSKTTKTVIDLSGDSGLDGSTYKYIKGVTGSSAGESLLISGNDAVVLQAAGENDTLFGAGKGSDTLVSASGMPTYYIVDTGIGDDIAQGFRFGAGSDTDQVLIDKSISYKADLVTASSGMVQIGTSKDLLELEGATGDSALVRYDYGNGDHQGVILADVSDGGGEITFNEVANLIVGQGEKTTLLAGANDDVKALRSAIPAGIGWNSNYISSNVGVIDVSASNMSAVNGQDDVENKVIAATGANIGEVWVCGGIGENFTDRANDTLVASGQGHDEMLPRTIK